MIRAILMSLLAAAPATAQVVGAASRTVSTRASAAAAAGLAPGAGVVGTMSPLTGPGVLPLASFSPAPLAVSAAAESSVARVAATAPAARAVPLPTPSAIAAARVQLSPAASPASFVSAAAENLPRPDSDDKDGEERLGPEKGGDAGRSMFDGAARRRGQEPLPEQPKPSKGRRALKSAVKGLTVSTVLVAANAGAYVAVPHTGRTEGLLEALSFDPGLLHDAIAAGAPWDILYGAATAVSAMFMHFSVEHIVSNMIGLLIFMPFVQWRFGWAKSLGLYLSGGLAACAAYTILGEYGANLGASAAVSAVAGAVLLARWDFSTEFRRTVALMVKFLSAMIIIPEVWSLFADGLSRPIEGDAKNHIATLAHVVGAATGFAAAAWFILRERWKARRAA